MGAPGLESNLLVVLLVLGALGGLAWILRPQLKRAFRYFQAWAERDAREEQEQKAQEALRQKAEAEVREYFHQDETETDQQVQKNTQ